MYFGIFFLALIWEGLRRLVWRLRVPPSLQGGRSWPVAVTACTLVAAFIAQLAVITYMAAHQIASPCWYNFPIPVVADLAENSGGPAQVFPCFLLVALAAAQSGLLLLLVRALRARPPSTSETRIIGAAVVVAVAAAVAAPAMTSSDPYLYLMYAKLGFAAFAPQPHAVNLPELPLAQWCTRRVLPSAYGPGFVWYIGALAGRLHSPVIAVLVMRFANVLWFGLLLWLLRSLGLSPALLAVTALNPALLFQYVANPHNDIIVCTLVVGAVVLAQRSCVAGALLVVVAALFKLPFVLIGCLIFVRLPSRMQRLVAASLTIASAIGLSYLIAGAKYFAGLTFYSRLLAPDADGIQWLAAVVALGAIGVALLRRQFGFAAIYAFPALPIVELAPWYAIWSLPYALIERTSLDRFLVLMPLMLMLMDAGISRAAQLTLYGVFAVAIAAGMMRDIARTRRPEPLPSEA
ncbi:MAG TPA: hypothetical protein VME66_13560 [Candidatus Acidoferrales bacterium]|nr:hypothetical protein [Candidatus Acidoferrales bacterium]